MARAPPTKVTGSGVCRANWMLAPCTASCGQGGIGQEGYKFPNQGYCIKCALYVLKLISNKFPCRYIFNMIWELVKGVFGVGQKGVILTPPGNGNLRVKTLKHGDLINISRVLSKLPSNLQNSTVEASRLASIASLSQAIFVQ